MHLRALCFLAWISLNLAAETNKWEVINDVKPWDDPSSQDELLSEEHLIPFKAPKPKPKSRSDSSQSSNSNDADNRRSEVKVAKVAPPPARQADAGRGLDEEQLLPLGVGAKRRLLSARPLLGPMLPPELEFRRSPKLTVEAVNLSTECKETDDDDCLFDVEGTLVEKMDKARTTATDHVEDDDLLLFSPDLEDDDEDAREQDVPSPLSRHRRQANGNQGNGNQGNDQGNQGNDDQVPDSDDSSGTSEASSDIYNQDETHDLQGKYKIKGDRPVRVRPANGTAVNGTLSPQDVENYKKEIRKQLKDVFKGLDFVDIEVGDPYIDENGNVVANWTFLLDGGAAASRFGNGTQIEEALFKYLNQSGVPGFNNILIFGQPLDPSSNLDSAFVDQVMSSLYDYCATTEVPCSKEYDITACINTGFMSGTCPHKCQTYGCQNGAVCELNDKYQPRCICGSRYTGQYCQTPKKKEKKLTVPETVGVALGAGLAGAAMLSCCCYLILCRKSDKNVKYTYYEDEEQFDHVSDPTSIANYYIDRPMISTTPISVFNSNAGFEA